jgi:hypothetical protein
VNVIYILDEENNKKIKGMVEKDKKESFWKSFIYVRKL